MSRDAPTSLLTRALRETLDVFVAPPVRNALLQDALRASGLSAIPTTFQEVSRFVQGPLRDMTCRALGPELAESIADEMSRVLERAVPRNDSSSEQRSRSRRSMTPIVTPSSPPPPSTRRSFSPSPQVRRSFTPRPPSKGQSYIRRQAGAPGTPLSPSDYFRSVAATALGRNTEGAPALPPLVLVVTTDERLLKALVGWLAGRAEVEAARSVFTLLRTIEERGASQVMVVLDAARPSLRPTAIAALADDLIDVKLVLVRSTQALEKDLMAISPSMRTWTLFRDATDIDEIASSCAALVG